MVYLFLWRGQLCVSPYTEINLHTPFFIYLRCTIEMRVIKIFSFFLLLFFLTPEFSVGNDTLVFVKKKKSHKEFRLPLNTYPVYIKPLGAKKMQCIIQSTTDSSFLVRVYHSNKSLRKKEKAATDSLWNSQANDTSAEGNLKLVTLTDSILKSMEYKEIRKVKISSIKYLKIYNGHRKEMKKFVTVNEAIMTISVLVLPFFVLAILIAPAFVYVLFFTLVLMTVSGIISLFTSFKKLDLKKNWKIKR